MATPKTELNRLKRQHKDLVNHQTAVIGRISQAMMDKLQKEIDELDAKIKRRQKEFAIMLDISTCHVSETTRKFLDEKAELNAYGQIVGVPCRMVRSEFGWAFWPTSRHPKSDWKNAPELKAINDFALDAGCMVVNFDAEADTNDRFPTFNW